MRKEQKVYKHVLTAIVYRGDSSLAFYFLLCFYYLSELYRLHFQFDRNITHTRIALIRGTLATVIILLRAALAIGIKIQLCIPRVDDRN